MKYILTLSATEKKFFEDRLRRLEKLSKNKMPLGELDQVNMHRGTLIYLLNLLEEKED